MSDETAEGSLEVDIQQFLEALDSLEERLADLQADFEKAAPEISGQLDTVEASATKASRAMDFLRATGSRVSSIFAQAAPHIRNFAHVLIEVSHFAGLIPSSLGFVGTALASLTGKISPLGPKMVAAVNQWLPGIKQGLRMISITDFAVQALQGRLGILGAAFGFVAGRALTGRTAMSAFGAATAYVVSTAVAAGRALTGLIRGLTGMIVSSLGSIGTVINMALPEFLPLITLVGLLAAAFALLKKAVHEASDIETTTEAYADLTNNAEQAKQAVEELISLSNHGPFEKGQLLDAGKQLLTLKFSAQELVPLLKDAGDASARMNKPLGDMVGIFGKIKGGQFADAFKGLHGFGISQADLEGRGLTFDRNHQFKGSADQAMTAVRAVIQDKFGGAADALSHTWSHLWSSLSTMVIQNFRAIGGPVLAQIKPILEQIVGAYGQTLPIAQRIGSIIGTGIGYVRSFLGYIVDGARAIGAQLMPILQPFIGQFRAIGGEMAAIFQQIAGLAGGVLAKAFRLLAPVMAGALMLGLNLLKQMLEVVNKMLAGLLRVITELNRFLGIKPVAFQGMPGAEDPARKPRPDAVADDATASRPVVGRMRELAGGGVFHLNAGGGGVDPNLEENRRQTRLLEQLVRNTSGNAPQKGGPPMPVSL
jgi:hypothetical protein